MTVVVTSRAELVVPQSVRRKAGIKTGDMVEFHVSGGIINIVPKTPSAGDEYTPAQRRVIDVRLKRALDEVKKGHVMGPFDSAGDMIASLKRQMKKTRRAKAKSPGR